MLQCFLSNTINIYRMIFNMYMFGVCHKNGDPFLSCDGQASVVIDDMAEFQTMLVGCPVMASCIGQWICFVGKIYRKTPYSMGKSMVSETNPLKPLKLWIFPLNMGLKPVNFPNKTNPLNWWSRRSQNPTTDGWFLERSPCCVHFSGSLKDIRFSKTKLKSSHIVCRRPCVAFCQA